MLPHEHRRNIKPLLESITNEMGGQVDVGTFLLCLVDPDLFRRDRACEHHWNGVRQKMAKYYLEIRNRA